MLVSNVFIVYKPIFPKQCCRVWLTVLFLEFDIELDYTRRAGVTPRPICELWSIIGVIGISPKTQISS